jgi:hypothetical protein
MSNDVIEDRREAALEAFRALTERPDPTNTDEELLVAADFAFRHGSLGDHFDEPDLSRLQFAFGPAGSAFTLLGHWSVERNDPLDGGPADAFEEHTNRCSTCRFLENARTMGDSFQYELCEVCGLDIDQHTIAGDPIGNPSSFCLTPFEVEDGEPFENGVQNDQQYNDTAYGVRFRARIVGDEGLWAVVTRTYYVLDLERGMQLVRDDEYIACTDPNRPGDTEVGSSGRVVDLDSDDPAGEDLVKLCNEAVYPSEEEWREHGAYWHGRDLAHAGQGE